MFKGKDGKYTNLRRYIPIHILHEKFSPDQQAILLPVYCLTGCDTVSGFYWHGKKSAFQLMMKNATKYFPTHDEKCYKVLRP